MNIKVAAFTVSEKSINTLMVETPVTPEQRSTASNTIILLLTDGHACMLAALK